jgi:iron-sulfur cluster repair protein YtfE (RIC family)
MNRVDVYSGVHKMQRARLFELTVAAGRLDPSDQRGRAELAVAVGAVLEELAAHADHEETFIHPVLHRVAPGIATELEREHATLDTALDDLRQAASGTAAGTGEPTTLYRALATFTARYLDHLAVEESAALPALWAACGDDELAGILAAFRSSRSDTENLTGVLAQLPTLNPTEATRMLHAGLGTVTEHDVALLLATLLDPHALGALNQPRVAPPAQH